MVNNSGRNTTAFNRTKQPRLAAEHFVPVHANKETVAFLNDLLEINAPKDVILYNIGKALIGNTENTSALAFLSENLRPTLDLPPVPQQFDLLGIVYQFLNSKLENLALGSFYTGPKIASDIVSGLDFSRGQTIIDPSCGSGALLFASDAPPSQIVGVDFDPLAILCAKFNYFIKFPDADSPNIYCADFFEWRLNNPNLSFDYVIGNPPYGADLDFTHIFGSEIKSGESFSHFIETGFQMLTESGVLRYLIPEALLNVTRHRDVRRLILADMGLPLIKCYSAKFAGVMSDIYRIDLVRTPSNQTTWQTSDGSTTKIPTDLFRNMKDQIFAHLTERDLSIIHKVHSTCSTSLRGSLFGLGVVTGNNKTMLHNAPIKGAEPIYTGKEMRPYYLSAPRQWLVFDRSTLQQVAPDEVYRANEKLVYKTISKRLMVAIDRSKSLTSNSANIIVPNVPGNTVDTLAALLNSGLYSFLNVKLFGGVNKVARANLEALPIPEFDELSITRIRHMIQKEEFEELERYIHENVFGLTPLEVEHIYGSIGLQARVPNALGIKAKGTGNRENFGDMEGVA